MLDFPPNVPKSRFPKKGMKKGQKVLMAGVSRISDDDATSAGVAATEN
jgi:hypothetical protein